MTSTSNNHPPPRSLDPAPGAGWTAGQLALLGLRRDDRVAALTGRSANAVWVKRTKLGIPNPSGHGWTAEELALLGTAPNDEVAARVGRTAMAVTQKRCKLGIPDPKGWGVESGAAGPAGDGPGRGSRCPDRQDAGRRGSQELPAVYPGRG